MPVYTVVEAGSAPPSPATARTIFGFGISGDEPLADYTSKWDGRAPMVRWDGDAFDLNGGEFQFTTGIAPERRICFSVRAGISGAYSMPGLVTGLGNSMLTDWCESIPQNWHVLVVFQPAPNEEIRRGDFTAEQFRGVYTQFRSAIDSAVLQPGVTVELVSNFMAYRMGDVPLHFDDSWVPPEADIMSIDLYSTPGHLTELVRSPDCSFARGAEYGASFPEIVARWQGGLEAIVRNGYQDSWAVLGHNAPPRDWDGPTNPGYVCGPDRRNRYQGGLTAEGHDSTNTEVERAAHLRGSIDYGQSRPVILGQQIGLPAYWLFSQHPRGVDWDQTFRHPRVWSTLKPYIVGTPVGGGTP